MFTITVSGSACLVKDTLKCAQSEDNASVPGDYQTNKKQGSSGSTGGFEGARDAGAYG